MSSLMTNIPDNAPREIRGHYGPHGDRNGQKELPALALSEWALLGDVSAPRWEFVKMIGVAIGSREHTERVARKAYPDMLMLN